MRCYFFCVLIFLDSYAHANRGVIPEQLRSSSWLELPTGFMYRGTPSVFGRSIEKEGAEILNFYTYLLQGSGDQSVFYTSSYEWGSVKDKMLEVTRDGLLSAKGVRIKCPTEHCFLFASGPFSLLVTANKNYDVVDFELISAHEKKDIAEFNGELKEGNIRLLLDTIFGSGGIPSRGKGWTIDFAENGIFCSEFYADNNGVPLDHAVYKRRVKPDGSIESKEIDNWYDCKAPW